MIKKFEYYSEYLTLDDIKDIFIDLLDDDYEIQFYDNKHPIGKYYFDFKKNYGEEYFNYIELGSVYGNFNLERIKKEIDNAFNILENSKLKINDMGYTIAYEMEFAFSAGSFISLTCHVQHSKYDNED